jgi:hypothetical protein
MTNRLARPATTPSRTTAAACSRSTISTTTQILGLAAHYKTSASRTNSTLRLGLTGSLLRRQTRDGGTVRFRSRIRTNTGTPPCPQHSGPNAWRPIPPATRATRQACVLRTACWKIRSIRPPAGHCGTRRAFTSRPWSSPVPMIPWSFPEDREGLIRDLVHTPVKRSVLIPDATHFVLFEKNRFQFASPLLFRLIPILSKSDSLGIPKSAAK